jgi:uncharacterized membrane protein
MMQRRKHFWTAFSTGAAAAAGAWVAVGLLRRARVYVERIEASTQIHRPPEEVFAYFAQPERLVHLLPELESIEIRGSRQIWTACVGDVPIRWQAEVTQVIPNQAIGWKSIAGPKHSGRVNFAPIGRDTEVHVVMNYAPSFWARFGADPGAIVSASIEDGLAHLKQALEATGFDPAATAFRRPPDAVAPAPDRESAS